MRETVKEIKCNISVRGLSEHSKTALAVLAGRLGVSHNSLYVSILEDAAAPYVELSEDILDRAQEVEARKSKPKQYSVKGR